ncbi:MAG TPA: DNA adenine methylase [Saprospiraceae bacterium]|nr:DNA adenine methylase [Saprospiraceae bacterium]
MKSPISYYGGKAMMVKTLESLIPDHKTYVESFAGGLSLFFHKQPSKIEVINDINCNVSNFYKQIKHNFNKLNEMIQDTLHCESTYNYARDIYRGRVDVDDITRAWAFWVGANYSFGGSVFDGSFQITTNSNDSCHPGTKSNEKRRRFLQYQHRLERAMILNKDAIEVISKYNNPDIFHYADPPYIGANQGHYYGYKLEDFKNLLDVASTTKSKIMISCYWHDIISDYNFNIYKKEMPIRISNASQKKTEIILTNYIKNDLFNSAV